MSRLREGIRTLVRHMSLWAASHGTVLWSGAIVLLLILVLIAVLTVPSIRDRVEELTGLASHEAPDTGVPRSPAPVGSDEADSRGPESLSGTWRVFQDDSESAPLFDLTFAPGGNATLLWQSDIQSTIEDWSYTESGNTVEIQLTYRCVGKDGGVFRPHGWLRMTRNGDEMRGSFGGDDYIYEGRIKGMTVRGQTTVFEAIYARPN